MKFLEMRRGSHPCLPRAQTPFCELPHVHLCFLASAGNALSVG
ncbi:FIG00554183: hypothetical protein [Cronobacter condimenti 1330]|uniref:Uncharacterized protein n=1 Tax=Cronobacter condimenti 1330 TaxID=1073999 RepID=K8A7K8_9ENTR|nr:FIG00554183: hypothetical protein [Cronobacter condimenti 1330]